MLATAWRFASPASTFLARSTGWFGKDVPVHRIARSARLAAVAKLRGLGWFPWLVFVLWGIVASIGEPIPWRSFGVSLSAQASWSVALILASVAMLCPPRVATSTSMFIANIALVAIFAVSQSVLWIALELAQRRIPDWSTPLESAVHLGLVGIPLAAALGVRTRAQAGEIKQVLINTVIVSLCVTVALAVAALPPPEARRWRPLSAVALAATAGALAVACAGRSAMIHRRAS